MTKILNNFTTFIGIVLLLASCARQKGPERLLPPEPVLIKEDMISAPKTGEEAQRPLPSWAQTKGDAIYKLGKPYKVNGVWYFPAENPRYDEIGFATRYPQSFQGQRTANGEIYNRTMLTASHKTLPLPSIVQVTNLENNKSIVVRINDRGPFVNDRLLDISEKAANLLDFPEEGNVKVRVQILSQESQTAASVLQASEKPVIPDAAYPPPVVKGDNETPTEATGDELVNITPNTPSNAESEPLFDSNSSSHPSPAAIVSEAVNQETGERTMAPVEQITPPGQTYYIQAGVFGNPSNAEKLANSLSSIAMVENTPVTINGRTLSRVRVGPFHSKDEADRILAQVKAQNLADARITVV